MKKLAIITARGGSKRIPRKNIKNFLGKPIIAYSIEAALQSELFDEVMVSTDDDEIAGIAMQYGAKVPFIRSHKNADDFSTTTDVIIEVLNSYKSLNIEFEQACCIYPTAPFISPEVLKNSYHTFDSGNYDSLFPVVKFGYPIQRSLAPKNGKIEMVWKEHLTSRSQDLETRFHDAGQFYWFNTETIRTKKALFTDNSGFFEVDELNVQDIDTETDWQLAELKFKLINE